MDAETVNEKKCHTINIPDIGKAVHFGTKEEVAEYQRKLDARGKFVKEYMRKKGWSGNMSDLSIDQIMEIREQDGWKNAL